MKLKKILSSVIAAAMVLSSMGTVVFAENAGTVNNAVSFAEALAAATLNNGVITYQVSGTVDYNHDSRGYSETLVGDTGATKVIIEGVDGTDATLNVVGYNGSNGANNDINPDGVEIEIRNIKITDNQRHYTSDSGWAVVSIAGTSVTLNNVTTDDVSLRLDGACGDLTIIGGTYNGPDGYYPIFIDNIGGNFTISGATIDSARGIKIGDARYQAVSGEVVIEDCVFNGLSKKPAVNVSHVNTETSSVEINNATLNNCEYGLLANEVTGSDITVDGEQPAYVAMWDGNLYTDSKYATEEAAEVGEEAAVAAPVAKIGNVYYTTFAEALKATNSMPDGAVIDLLGNTVSHTKDWTRLANPVKITNGTIDITNGQSGSGYFIIDSAANTDGVVDFELNNIKLVGSNFGGISAVILAEENGTVIKFDNVDVNLENGGNIGAVLRGSTNKQIAIINNTNINLKDVPSVIGNINVEMTNTTINSTYDTVNKSSQNNAFRNLYGTITDSTINVNGSENGIKNTSVSGMTEEQQTLTLSGKTAITLMGAVGDGTEAGYDLQMAGNASLVLEDDSKLEVDTSLVENNEKITDDTANSNGFVSKAETIYVQFRNISTGDDYADKKNSVWEIVLVGANSETINELASVDLTFENNSKLAADSTKENPYTIAAKAGMTLSKKGDNRYMFSFDANTVEETKAEISLGTVTFGGYGALDFKVNESVSNVDNQNIANATEIKDSIVDTFVVGGAAGKGTLVINTDAPDDVDTNNNLVGVIGGTSVEVPSRNLKINVTFPNAVEDNVIAYQDMIVTVKGTNVATSKVDTFTYNLGEDDGNAMDANGNYVIENIKLSQNGTYTVTVTGAGYRTVSYDVHMTDDKELTFWNNVMDADKVVETNNADSAKTVTFLAGDIVKDDNINIYDLSAVVSYFATKTTTTGYDEKAQYDLNRDGMIDSKDVAYVLVSWGK